jgi:hypothetical protein
MSDRLSLVVPAIAANEQTITSRITHSRNSENVGKALSRPAFYELYLVNESKSGISRVDLISARITAKDGNSVASRRFTTTLGEIKCGNALLLEQLDLDALDFMINYDLKLLFTDGFRQRAAFSFTKEKVLFGSNYRYFGSLESEAHGLSLESAGELVGFVPATRAQTR